MAEYYDQQGFTLLEVMVAVVILGLSYVAILQSFSLSARNIIRVEESRFDNLQDSMFLDRQLNTFTATTSLSADYGEIFVTGTKYKLVIIESVDGAIKTLQLQRL